METIRALAEGDAVTARTNALVLCEGYETEPFLRAAANLSRCL